MQRGVLYVTWGDIAPILNRSIASLKTIHPELPVEVIHGAGESLRAKTMIGQLSPFESTLYLDADTIVMGRLDFAFEKAERFGLACCICEAPWMRRYGVEGEENFIEYNTGVLFFTRGAAPVYAWPRFADTPSSSRWRMHSDPPERVRGLAYDDQASFSRAVEAAQFNPFILPINYNLRPNFHRSFFGPVRIWHDYSEPPPIVTTVSCADLAMPPTYFELDHL